VSFVRDCSQDGDALSSDEGTAVAEGLGGSTCTSATLDKRWKDSINRISTIFPGEPARLDERESHRHRPEPAAEEKRLLLQLHAIDAALLGERRTRTLV
jgi:hypothetical protein